jgi:hypothetical protein
VGIGLARGSSTGVDPDRSRRRGFRQYTVGIPHSQEGETDPGPIQPSVAALGTPSGCGAGQGPVPARK